MIRKLRCAPMALIMLLIATGCATTTPDGIKLPPHPALAAAGHIAGEVIGEVADEVIGPDEPADCAGLQDCAAVWEREQQAQNRSRARAERVADRERQQEKEALEDTFETWWQQNQSSDDSQSNPRPVVMTDEALWEFRAPDQDGE